jgi:arsenate reductase-like glutaredoxin family protein
MTCKRTQEFLAKKKIETLELADAKKQKMGERQALTLAKQVDEIYAAKGKKVVHLNLRRDRPDAATLKGLLIGPSGNLRAPTLRVKRTLLVGFDEGTYRKVLVR